MARNLSWKGGGTLLEYYLKTRTDAASGSYSPPAGWKYIEVTLQGGGGGGGGGSYDTSSNRNSGGGGGAGGYLRDVVIPNAGQTSFAWALGAAGTGGTGLQPSGGAAGSGTNGGDSSVTNYLTSEGGDGGTGGDTASGVATGGAGGAIVLAANANLSIQGPTWNQFAGAVGGDGGQDSTTYPQDAGPNVQKRLSGVDSGQYYSGAGGGASGAGDGGDGGTNSQPGQDATGYGAGGGGGAARADTNIDGGDGTEGFIIIKAYG